MSFSSILIRKSTGEVIKYASYPNINMQPVEGLDNDLEWLVEHEPVNPPIYDARIYNLIRNHSITSIPHPVYTWLNQYQITYNLVKKQNSEIEQSIILAENEANLTMLPYEKQLKLIALSIGVIFKNTDNSAYTVKENTIRTKMLTLATRLWQNDQNYKNKITEITNNIDPSIDQGWETGE